MNAEAEARRTRVMIVEDHADFRALMEVLLGRQPDIELLAQAGSLGEARAHAARFELDVAILDLGLPDGSGADLIADLRQTSPAVRVLVLSASLDPEGIEKASSAGVDEILDKLTPVEEVLATVRRLGNARFPRNLRPHPDGAPPRDA
jgi:DNA-binding NarL/FixJ family response regulator